MSLILEALKKSETRRRLGEAPDIGTPFTVKPRRRNPWPVIVILVAVAAGVGWWYVRTVPSPTDGNTSVSQPPTSPPATGKSPANAQQTGAQVARAGPTLAAREAASARAQSTPDGSVPAQTARPPPRAGGNTAGETAPGGVDAQSMRAVNRHLSLPPTSPSAPANPTAPAAPAASGQPPAMRAATSATAAVPIKPPAQPAGALPVEPATVPKAEPEAVPTKPAAVAPAVPAAPPAQAAPAVPQYYELAYAVRKEIPQFNLSMHVFAADPAARFIVVDGERKVEGDAVKEGLVLHEVRIDGVVLEFRGQRFFYPRPGH